MSNILADVLFNPANAPKRIVLESLRKYVQDNFKTKQDTLARLKKLMRKTPNFDRLRIVLPAGLAKQASVHDLFNAPNLQIERKWSTGGWRQLGRQAAHRKNVKAIVQAIRIEECTVLTILAPQPDRKACKGEDHNFSELFVLKHAQSTTPRAAGIARQRFNCQGPFENDHAAPLSQNIVKASFRAFRSLVDLMIKYKVVSTVDSLVKAMLDKLLLEKKAVQTVQWITRLSHVVRTFERELLQGDEYGLVNDSPMAATQHIQFAFTQDDVHGNPIVNHFTTPITDTEPHPRGWAWREIDYSDVVKANAMADKLDAKMRPRIFYNEIPLTERTDI